MTFQKKGRSFELEIAKDLRDSGLDKNARRQVRSGAIYGREGDISASLPVSIECKCHEKTNFSQWFDQALNRNKSKIPVVVWKQEHGIPYVYFKWSDFIEILSWAIQGGLGQRLLFPKPKRYEK